MAKIADGYLGLDPWKIIETGWSSERNDVSESIFSLGNEYSGVRGYFEEGCRAKSLLGSYFNGIYAEEKTEGSAYRGIVDKTHFMLNASDWLHTRISLGGEDLVPGETRISGFVRTLDMAKGTLERSYVWTARSGKSVKISFLRFLDMESPEYAWQRVSFTPVGFNGPVTVLLGVDFATAHGHKKKQLWKQERQEFFHTGSDARSAAVLARTATTGQLLWSGFSWASNRSATPERRSSDRFAGFLFELPLMDGEETVLIRRAVNVCDKKRSADADALWKRATALAASSGGRDGIPNADQSAGAGPLTPAGTAAGTALDLAAEFRLALERQEAYWARFWRRSDIRIEGDEANQQGIRFCLFQMQQTYHGLDPSNNIGAKGLTGEAYNGHAFWDTETYCLPFFLFSEPAAAKNLLEFRYSTLPQAKERAKMLDCRGACYPVATLNGEEACNLWQHASLQFQPGTAVAYGIEHYVRATGDDDFLFGHGAEMLVEISRFLLSRGAWNRDRTGFGFYAVMGPDEFHMMVNNNCYTNFMAKKTFELTLRTIERMKKERPGAHRELVAKTGFGASEAADISRAAEAMILLFDPETGLYEQHEGFFSLPHVDPDSIPVTDFPLYHNWSYDRIYRTDLIKQPDVLMFMFLYPGEFEGRVKRCNYDYYEPRTIHESSLSPSIHSVFAAELGMHAEAFRFFGFATRMDLDNYNRNTGEGLHTTSIAAAWVNIVYGFGGFRSDRETISFAPSLPAAWSRYEFSIVWRGAVISVSVTPEAATVSRKDGALFDVPFLLYGEEKVLSGEPVSVPLPAGKRG